MKKRALRASFRLLRNLAENGVEGIDEDRFRDRELRTLAEEARNVTLSILASLDLAEGARAVIAKAAEHGRIVPIAGK